MKLNTGLGWPDFFFLDISNLLFEGNKCILHPTQLHPQLPLHLGQTNLFLQINNFFIDQNFRRFHSCRQFGRI